MKQKCMRNKVTNRSLSANTDDLVTHIQVEMQQPMEPVQAFGLIISVSKIVVMYQSTPGKIFVNLAIFIGGKRLGVADHFVYLGSALSQDNSLDREICLTMEKMPDLLVCLRKGFEANAILKPLPRWMYAELVFSLPFLHACDI